MYRTKAGFRIVLLNRRLPPQDPLVQRLMTAFRADPDYQQLCKFQQSYRARLTPKPTYLKMAHPPFRYPESATWGRPSVEQWEREYESKSQGFRVCQPIQDIGPHGIDPEVEFLLGLHDQSCRASVDLPLA